VGHEADYEVGEASTQYGDFKGTVAADTHGGGTRELADVIGLDVDRYWIVGIDIGLSNVLRGGLTVLAIDRASGIRDHRALVDHVEAHGSIPVTSFLVHDIPLAEILRVGLKRLDVQLVSRSIPENARLHVVYEGDLNYSGD
jgi:hypothetical protein